MQILHQNVHGVRDTLANFLELNIYAVRKDIQEKKIAMGEVVQFQLVKTEGYNFQTPSSSSSQQLNYSTSSPSLDASTVSTSQQNYVKSEPRSSGSSQEQGASPNLIMPINTITTSVTYQMVKMEPGSSRSSPILRTSSPHFQLLNKSHGSVGANEPQQHRASPLTITRDTSIQMPMQQPKTSPLAATTAPNIEMQTLSFFDQNQEPMETSQVPSPQETTFITPTESQPQHVQQQQPQSQVSPPLSQEAAIDDDTPLTELPHEIALKRSLIDPETFSALMQRKVPGITIESPAFLMISEFLETKIRKLIGDARLAAEHRSQQFRSNPNYIEAENPRAQLNAIERAEKAEKQRKIDRENEKLLKNSKNDSNKFKELAKTIDEEILNRDANEAAMSALAGKKRTWQSRKADGISDSGGPAAKKAALARAKQISMKDLLFAFEKDSFAKDSIVYRKVLYGLYNENKN
uniref:Transcription initiation factor TFIID component TAF4 C-terminal domain-containing protein n=1 Tax=Panagrolaimus superbus TaxID=310955 RepID=A0A914Y7K0_9BILA